MLAGGADPRLSPLTNTEHPKCLLPVANSPAILYALTAVRDAGITSIFVVRHHISALTRCVSLWPERVHWALPNCADKEHSRCAMCGACTAPVCCLQ